MVLPDLLFPVLQRLSSYFHRSTVIAITLFFVLLCACIVIGHLLEENRWANESITALLLVSSYDCHSCNSSMKKTQTEIYLFGASFFFFFLFPSEVFVCGSLISTLLSIYVDHFSSFDVFLISKMQSCLIN